MKKRGPFFSTRGNAAIAFLLCGTFMSCNSHDHPHPHGEGDHSHDANGGHTDHGEHEAGHGHGEGAMGVTQWTDTLELFAEYPPAITGKEVPFLAHLTLLPSFEALEDATVTLVLDGPAHAEAKVTKMLRSGIFQPVLEAPAPGTYQASLRVQGPRVDDTIVGFEIVVHPNATSAVAVSSNDDGAGAEPISFLKEQQWQIPFGTAFAQSGSVTPTIEVAGEVSTPPSGQAEIGAPIAGRVIAPSGGIPSPGETVRKGQLLASIAAAPAAPEAGARADLAVVEAEARLQTALAAVERADRLIADRAIAQREVEGAHRELGVAEEAVRASNRARDVFTGAAGGASFYLTAPLAGVLVEVRATTGQSVQGGEQLFRVVNLDEIWIKARVPEQQAALIRADEDAAYRLPGTDRWTELDVTGDAPTASVVNVGRAVDRRSRTVEVIYALKAVDERLRIDAMVRVAVPAGDPWHGVVVPSDAVLEDDGRSVVYVQLEGEAFEERAVRLGPRSGSFTGVVNGVRAGERVVTLGANFVRLASRASTAPSHGHVH
ncbi:MAG: efflux RND transporter periplasmic adaptor subunit [Myxococcota bacterium]